MVLPSACLRSPINRSVGSVNSHVSNALIPHRSAYRITRTGSPPCTNALSEYMPYPNTAQPRMTGELLVTSRAWGQLVPSVSIAHKGDAGKVGKPDVPARPRPWWATRPPGREWMQVAPAAPPLLATDGMGLL